MSRVESSILQTLLVKDSKVVFCPIPVLSSEMSNALPLLWTERTTTHEKLWHHYYNLYSNNSNQPQDMCAQHAVHMQTKSLLERWGGQYSCGFGTPPGQRAGPKLIHRTYPTQAQRLELAFYNRAWMSDSCKTVPLLHHLPEGGLVNSVKGDTFGKEMFCYGYGCSHLRAVHHYRTHRKETMEI